MFEILTVLDFDASTLQNNGKAILEVLPKFSFSQDDEFVHLVIDAYSFQPGAVTYQLPALQDAISLKLTDAVTPSGLVDYSLYLKFTNGCTINKNVMVDVSVENVVVALEKQPSCKGSWEMFLAGSDQRSLQEKKFLTEENIKTIFDEESQSSVFDEDSANDVQFNVTTLNADKMHLQVSLVNGAVGGEMNGTENGKADGGEDNTADDVFDTATVDGTGEVKMQTKDDSKMMSENEVTNLATAWQNLNLDGCNSSSSPPSTPTSPSSLKSLLRSNRRRAHKSVSFCEEVEIEILVKKGKSKKGQLPKMKRAVSYEKIKDNSWNCFSDSEFVLNSENIKVNIIKPRETGQNKRRNRRTQKYNAARNSDSEVVDSKTETSREKSKVKLSKKQMRRQKRLNNRNDKLVSESASERSETSETSEEEDAGKSTEVNEPVEISEDEVLLNIGDPQHVNNNNLEMKNKDVVDDDKPLELQDHKTTSAVSFSNILIHELD